MDCLLTVHDAAMRMTWYKYSYSRNWIFL